MRSAIQNKAAVVVSKPVAPTPVNLDAALDPATIAAAVDKFTNEQVQPLEKERRQAEADIELETAAIRVRRLELQRAGVDDLKTDEAYRLIQGRIERRQERITGINLEIDELRQRADEMKSAGPAILRATVETQRALLRALKDLAALFDQAREAQKAAEDMRVNDPRTGLSRFIGLPRSVNGGSPFPVVYALKDLFDRRPGQRTGFDRIARDAAEIGLEA
jgi:hypothetical protein